MYTQGPTSTEAAAWGLTLEEASGQAIEVWPDNVQALNVFIQMSTQWRASATGSTGLDYTALESLFRILRIPRAEWPLLFEEIRTLEDAALEKMREKN
jgi:hypothetical protein